MVIVCKKKIILNLLRGQINFVCGIHKSYCAVYSAPCMTDVSRKSDLALRLDQSRLCDIGVCLFFEH